MPYEGPGIYEHWKGGNYRVVGLGRHESTGARLVVYHSYDVEHEKARAIDGIDFVLRPLDPEDGDDAFNDRMTSDAAVRVPRFQRIA